jgi:hypothetical protein
MKKISVALDSNNKLTVDLGGDLDGRCCGYESRQFKGELYKLGVETNMLNVLCRLPEDKRSIAKLSGDCNFDIPLNIRRSDDG